MNFTSSNLGVVALDLLLIAVRPRKPVAVVGSGVNSPDDDLFLLSSVVLFSECLLFMAVSGSSIWCPLLYTLTFFDCVFFLIDKFEEPVKFRLEVLGLSFIGNYYFSNIKGFFLSTD